LASRHSLRHSAGMILCLCMAACRLLNPLTWSPWLCRRTRQRVRQRVREPGSHMHYASAVMTGAALHNRRCDADQPALRAAGGSFGAPL
jgi:hypothetical protein